MYATSATHERKVVVRLNSGLGNQLFQLAQGFAVAQQYSARLLFDTTWFRLVAGMHPVKRQLRLSEFGVSLPEAFTGPRRLAVGFLAAFFDKTHKGKSLLSALGAMRVIQEDTLGRQHEDELKDLCTKRIFLNGYWQTNRPFLTVRGNLLEKLQPMNRLSNGAAAIIAKAGSVETGFIHVRRGDYVHFMGEGGVLPLSYYSNALAKVREGGKEVARWLIISEDTAWVHANLQFVPNAEVVNYQSPNRDIEDLMIMKACSAGIIANSSYSWWGAALGDRSDRPIIAPGRYWRNSDWSTEEWALPNWTRMQAWD
jgi:hypothetical protein